MADPKKKPSLDEPPSPPELRTRKGIAGMVKQRDDTQGGTMPGMGGPNAIGERAMAAEQALGALAQVMPDPAPLTDIIARLRAAVLASLQSAGGPPQQGAPASPGLGGIVAPPPPVAPPAAGGMGMPAPPLM